MVFSGISFKKELQWLKLSWREEIFYLIIPKTNIEKACHLSVYADNDGKIMAIYADFHPKYAAATKCCYMALDWYESWTTQDGERRAQMHPEGREWSNPGLMPD